VHVKLGNKERHQITLMLTKGRESARVLRRRRSRSACTAASAWANDAFLHCAISDGKARLGAGRWTATTLPSTGS